VRNQEIKLNMPKNYGINIFDHEGPQALTHTVVIGSLSIKYGREEKLNLITAKITGLVILLGNNRDTL